MAYETSVGVTTRNTFLTNLITFVVAEAGFVDEGTTTDGSYTLYHISRTTSGDKLYWTFVEYDQSIGGDTERTLRCKLAYAKIITYTEMNAASVNGQSRPTELSFYKNNGPYIKSHFFTEGNSVHAVVEVYNNCFAMLSFGVMDKYGTWTGGEYIQASNTFRNTATYNFSWDYVYASILFDGGVSSTAIDSRGNYIRNITGASALGTNYDFARTGGNSQFSQQSKMVAATGFVGDLVENASPTKFNQRAPLFPVYVRVYNSVTDNWILKGNIPYARILNITRLTPSSIIENDWMVFPFMQKSDGDISLSPLSDGWGMAFLKDA